MTKQGGRIAFFDSGIGGLSVLHACAPALNQYIYYYFGDVCRAPYGNLTSERITAYTKDAFDLFQGLNVDAAVIACNTVTAVCIDQIRKEYSFPVVGAEPSILPAAKENGEVFVLTTRATYQSPRFQNLLKRAGDRYPLSKITAYPCDGLAGAIERGEGEYERFLPKGKPKSVVLGCTHYILIKECIEKFYGVKTFDGNLGIVNRLKTVLNGKNLVSADQNQPLIQNNSLFLPKSSENPLSIFFLGDGKMVTKTKYEQMFVIKKSEINK